MAYESIITFHDTHKNKNSKFLPPQMTHLEWVHSCESLHKLDTISVFSKAPSHPANYKKIRYSILPHM